MFCKIKENSNPFLTKKYLKQLNVREGVDNYYEDVESVCSEQTMQQFFLDDIKNSHDRHDIKLNEKNYRPVKKYSNVPHKVEKFNDNDSNITINSNFSGISQKSDKLNEILEKVKTLEERVSNITLDKYSLSSNDSSSKNSTPPKKSHDLSVNYNNSYSLLLCGLQSK